MTKLYPTGKGFYNWIIRRVEDGDPQRSIERAKKLGLSFIVPKILSGYTSYNLRQTENGGWVDDILPPYTDAFLDAGIDVYGYQYIYLDDPELEAEAAVARMDYLNLSGLIIDAEVEAKYKPVQAEIYAKILIRELPFTPIGLASYRYPSYHPELPWEELLSCCTFHNPQVYWAQAHNPGDQLEKSYIELKNIRNLPVIPIGAAYDEHGWKPTREEINEFDWTAKDMELPGICWWEWYEAIQNDFEKTIGMHDWGTVYEPPGSSEAELGILDMIGQIRDKLDEMEAML